MISYTEPDTWHKSSHSYANGNCVEVRQLEGGGTDVRDSKNPGGPVLSFTATVWAAFMAGVKAGEFDRT